MSPRDLIKGPCFVPGCPNQRDTYLGTCAECWGRLPERLQRGWWEAWRNDCRVSEWLAARRACIEHLSGVAA